MPREFSRNDRVADALQRELAQLIRDEVRDPRLGMVNITAVEVSRDLSSARVYINLVDADSTEANQQAEEILNGASGFLRSLVAKHMALRIAPRMRFIYDQSGKHGQSLSALIDYAVNADKSRAGANDDSDGLPLDDK